VLRPARSIVSANEGAQIVEFAIILPLLVVLVVGIFDFGTGFNLKQTVVNAAAVGARIGSAQPSSDLSTVGSCGAPASICALRDAVDNELVTNRVPDCGLATAAGVPSGTPLSWTFTPGGCTGTMSLQFERGFVLPTVVLPNPPFQALYAIEATRVTLIYPYKWSFDFNGVARLLNPSANYPTTSQLKSVAVMQNQN
jgi:hypothetical protein